jgi:hypothetical protein
MAHPRARTKAKPAFATHLQALESQFGEEAVRQAVEEVDEGRQGR